MHQAVKKAEILLKKTPNITVTALSIGVCYGRVADNLPPVDEVIDLFHISGIGRMRIYDPDQATLQALRRSNIELIIGVRNEDIKLIANSVSAATGWIRINILKYSQDVKFRYIVVGNKIDPTNDPTSGYVLLARQNIYTALRSSNLRNKIKASTAIQLNLLGSSYPPSSGAFSHSATPFITPIVKFLVDTNAPLPANVYTYFSHISDPTSINISFALFTSQSHAHYTCKKKTGQQSRNVREKLVIFKTRASPTITWTILRHCATISSPILRR